MSENMLTENKQYVIFKLGEEEYAIEIYNILIIEKFIPITRVPHAPEFVTGVINLRGDIIPVVDLRIKFGIPIGDVTEETRFIVIKIKDITFAVIADYVDEVIEMTPQIEQNISNIDNDVVLKHVAGVGKYNDKIFTILNVETMIV